ncbi:hypothetical protein D3C72_1616160 [compost metagenome]
MISVFKTTVTSIREIETLKPFLDTHLGIAKWNFDLEDCDNILRIDSINEITERTIKILSNYGFDCQELEGSPVGDTVKSSLS